MNRKANYKNMERYTTTRNRQRKRYYNKTANAPNGGKAWTEHETAIVLAHEMTDTEISAMIGRSVAAIQKQRNKYKPKSN